MHHGRRRLLKELDGRFLVARQVSSWCNDPGVSGNARPELAQQAVKHDPREHAEKRGQQPFSDALAS